MMLVIRLTTMPGTHLVAGPKKPPARNHVTI